jgi:4-diphosphocytidyl-2-C-methyl-D-erythritol kinase
VTTLSELAPGKVNLCLFLGPTREDGRHELVTVYESVSLVDELTLTVLPDGEDEVVCPGVEGPNLVSRALAALRDEGWVGPPVRIEIVKRIPVAAGMGGGSADAAAALRLATRLAPYPDAVMHWIAERLGADVPAQLTRGLSLGTGAGEVVEQLAPLAPHAFVIVPLAAQLSTADVYAEADRLELPRTEADLRDRLAILAANLRGGVRLPQPLLVNDLEPAARSLCPEIDPALSALFDAGADDAFVSGSGPTCAGLFWDPEAAAAVLAAIADRFAVATIVHPV